MANRTQQMAATTSAVAWSISAADTFSVITIDLMFGTAPTSSGNVTVKIDSGAGAAYDRVVQTVSAVGQSVMRLNQVTGLVSGDAVLIEYANPDGVSITGEATVDVRPLTSRDGMTYAGGVIRAPASNYRRYYHVSLGSFDPGASGATFTRQGANQRAGYLLDAASEYVAGHIDVHSDWDGTSDPNFEIELAVQSDNSGGTAADNINLKIVTYYSSPTNSIRTQTIAYSAVVGAAAKYSVHRFTIPMDWDKASNVIVAGDGISFELSVLATGTLTAAIINSISFYYNKSHVGIESSDI